MISLGDRMKGYEEAVGPVLLRRTPVIIRVDGKAFHTFTKQLSEDRDPRYKKGHHSETLWLAMTQTAKSVCAEMQNVVLAYRQSDEISFLLKDWTNNDTQQWFDGKVQKIVSIAAAMTSVYFNQSWDVIFGPNSPTALFDARAFNVPLADVDNYFIWRQRDALRNGVNFVARQYFSHKQLHGKNRQDVIDMLLAEGVDWAAYPLWEQRGSCIVYRPLLDGRWSWCSDHKIPIFQDDRDYIMSRLASEE